MRPLVSSFVSHLSLIPGSFQPAEGVSGGFRVVCCQQCVVSHLVHRVCSTSGAQKRHAADGHFVQHRDKTSNLQLQSSTTVLQVTLLTLLPTFSYSIRELSLCRIVSNFFQFLPDRSGLQISSKSSLTYGAKTNKYLVVSNNCSIIRVVTN